MISHLKDWERTYGQTTVYVKEHTKKGMAGPIAWTDVYLQQGQQNPLNLSQCDGQNCGQPSLSQHGRMVVYIREKY